MEVTLAFERGIGHPDYEKVRQTVEEIKKRLERGE